MTTPKQRYNENLQAIQGHISEVERENRVNKQRIGELKTVYEQHVNAVELEQADAAAAEMERLRRTIESREKQLVTLKSEDYPARKQAKAQYIAELDEQAEGIKAEFADVHREILEARTAYIEAAQKALPVMKRFYDSDAEKQRVQSPGQQMIPRHDLGGGIDNYEVRKGEIVPPFPRLEI